MAHIPNCSTDQLELVTFRQALDAANVPSPDYDVTKWLYAPPFYSEYRYILGTRGKNPLICIGINPSTAEPDNLDNTLKSVERIALGNGFDSFIMFNVYAQRATSPDDMEKTCNLQLHKENLEAFRYVAVIPGKQRQNRGIRSGKNKDIISPKADAPGIDMAQGEDLQSPFRGQFHIAVRQIKTGRHRGFRNCRSAFRFGGGQGFRFRRSRTAPQQKQGKTQYQPSVFHITAS